MGRLFGNICKETGRAAHRLIPVELQVLFSVKRQDVPAAFWLLSFHSLLHLIKERLAQAGDHGGSNRCESLNLWNGTAGQGSVRTVV